MITHIFLGSNDIERSRKFYDAMMAVLGHKAIALEDKMRAMYHVGNATLILRAPANGAPASYANGGTIGLAAQDDAQVDAWHAAGKAAGGADEGAPGRRERHPSKAYGAYLRDPDGNKLCCYNTSK